MCNMLSYVEFYRPNFFLLENVLGLLNHKLQMNKAGPQEGDIVAHGVVKFILRTLTSLGYVTFPAYPPANALALKHACTSATMGWDRYQVRFSVLQAGVYGSPQGRRRVIFWGARRGVPLPEFPIPTHNFETGQWAVQLDTGLKLDHVGRDPDMPHRGAPLRAVTVDDAISDLVCFSFSHFSTLRSLLKVSPSRVPFYRCCFCVCIAQPKFDWHVSLCRSESHVSDSDTVTRVSGKTPILFSGRHRLTGPKRRGERQSPFLLSRRCREVVYGTRAKRTRTQVIPTACSTRARRAHAIKPARAKESRRTPTWSSTIQRASRRPSWSGQSPLVYSSLGNSVAEAVSLSFLSVLTMTTVCVTLP